MQAAPVSRPVDYVIARSIPIGTHVVEAIMPKRKRKLARKIGTVTKSSLTGDVEYGHDTDEDGYLGEDDVDFLKELEEEGRLTFLKDLAP